MASWYSLKSSVPSMISFFFICNYRVGEENMHKTQHFLHLDFKVMMSGHCRLFSALCCVGQGFVWG